LLQSPYQLVPSRLHLAPAKLAWGGAIDYHARALKAAATKRANGGRAAIAVNRIAAKVHGVKSQIQIRRSRANARTSNMFRHNAHSDGARAAGPKTQARLTVAADKHASKSRDLRRSATRSDVKSRVATRNADRIEIQKRQVAARAKKHTQRMAAGLIDAARRSGRIK
jgi:hypothetical protein